MTFRLLALLLFAGTAAAQPAGDLRPTCYAVRGARVVVEPGTVLGKATVVVRDGLITAVGPDVTVPPDAAVIDGAGLTVYPGFVDAGSPRGFDPAVRRSAAGPPVVDDIAADALVATKPDHRRGITPEFAVATALKPDDEAVAPWRKAGFTAALAAPDGGFLSGTSALVSLSGAAPRDTVLKTPVAQHAAIRTLIGAEYPRALMGSVAHCRQVFLDAGWAKRQVEVFEKKGRAGRRPVADPSLEALWPALDGTVPVAFEANTRDQILRALDLATEFKLKPVIVGGKDAWKVADRLKADGVPVILRLDFAEPGEREGELAVRVREDLERKRQESVGTAAALHKAGVKFAFSTAGLAGDKGPEKFREAVRKVIAAGLPADAALATLTTGAAELLGVGPQLGKVEVGRPAHLLVADGDWQAEKTKYKWAFADGVRFDLTLDAAPPAAPTEAATAGGRGNRKGPREPGASPQAAKADPSPPEAKAERKGPNRPAPIVAGDAVRALVPVLDAVERATTETEADRKPRLKTGGDVLIRGVTVVTVSGPVRPNTDVLVRKGKIAQLGDKLEAPEGVAVVEAAGLFVMPGIIDTHSHFAVSGGVNEFSLSVVPEVRVRDVIDSEDEQIYRAAAGGVTTARLLHGSANVVGGQDAVIKMKVGRPATEMLVSSGPRGVKFALGENVKRTDGRFPNSRLGVEAVLVRAFSEAREYKKKWDEYEKRKTSADAPPEPRRDLRLEALADVLAGDIKVHSHCYRADEILMLLRVADKFGVKVKSLQHVLEGYKVAPEIAAHGASVSLFSDWWAYKLEAYDAIPYAAKLLHDAGADVCLKSDDNELMRHLYQEAAKLVKYGGMAPEEALKTITLNPAKQLGLESRLGSIEVGKDADLALFTGHPLNAYSRCELTLVEGEVVFQRADELKPFAPAATAPPAPVEPLAIRERPNGVYVLTGATIHPADGEPFKGTVVVRGKEITHVLKAGEPLPDLQAGATTVDLTGRHVYPGMIDAGTVLGLVEIDSAKETADFRDGGDFQPDLRAATGINPDSELIPVTRANGVLSAVTRPTGSLMAGQAALINLAGWVPAEMVVTDPLALCIEYPQEVRPRPFFADFPEATENAAKAKREREDKLRKLRDLIEQARRYAAAKDADPTRPVNPRLEALAPYVKGEKPVMLAADRKSDILAALKLADELKLKVILTGASEAWKVADELKRRDVPVVLGPVMTIAREAGERYDAPYTAAAKLHAAGVRFCIRSAGSNNTRNLPYEAAMAVSYGLPPQAGLRSVTLSAAEILGADKLLGDVTAGRRANLVVTNGDLLQPSTQVLALFVDGRPHEPTSKQTRLYDRYQKRLGEVKEKTGQ